jgi:hypothetical protein
VLALALTGPPAAQVDGTERLTGNYIEGVSNFKYMYDNAKLKEDKPWTAFFTGGNRLTQKPDRGSGYLRNNHNGRFRLEVTVNLNFGTLDSAGIIDRNSAPSAIARPVLPVPYTGRGMESAYGMAATFQVSAFNAPPTCIANDQLLLLRFSFHHVQQPGVKPARGSRGRSHVRRPPKR